MKTDSQLQHDVLAQLDWEPSIDASQIGVTAKESVVTLTGSVATYAAKMTAERATKSVYGVKGVANDIEVKIPGTIQRTDAEIAAAALNALHWDAVVPDDRIRVTVRDGWVALEGDAQWQYQRDAAERDVRNLTGVRGVTDQITLKSRAQPGEVKQKIEAAFRRSAEVDARRVRVEARDGKVILHGNVRSFAEREEAQQAAWAAPGVVDVDNRLSVIP